MAREKHKNQAEHSRTWYLKHREEQIKRVLRYSKKYQAKARAFVEDHKKHNPCVDCGETDPIVLDFDHISDNKKMSICRMMCTGHSVKSIEEEMAKCEVRCSNCHRRVTHYRREAKRLAAGNRA